MEPNNMPAFFNGSLFGFWTQKKIRRAPTKTDIIPPTAHPPWDEGILPVPAWNWVVTVFFSRERHASEQARMLHDRERIIFNACYTEP
jgi:hypothetical protein